MERAYMGACIFTDKWSLDELAYGIPTDGPYETNPPSPYDIISYIRIDQEGLVYRIHHEEEIDVHEHQILTREIVPTLKPLEKISGKMSFVWGLVQGIVHRCLQQDDILNGVHVDVTDDSPAIPEHTTVKTPMNMSPANKAHFEAEKEAIHLILTGIGDEIHSTVDACQTAQEMWEAIERLQQAIPKKVNELRTERLARNSNPLAVVATAQANQDAYYQTSKSQKSYAPSSKSLIPTRTHTTTRYKGKEIAKPITPPSEIASERTVNVAGARENVGSPVVNQSGIQCFNCKEFGHFVKECRKPKRFKDSAYTDEEIDEQELEAHYSYMAKIQEVLTADSVTDSEPLEQVQNDVGYNVFANDLQHFEQFESISNTCLVETDDRNVIPDSLNMCEDDIQNDQNDVESDDERVALANLIANLKLDTGFEKYKAFNDRTVDYDKLERKLNENLGQLAQKDIEIKEGLKTKAHEISVVKEKHDELIKQSLLTKSHYEGLVKQKTKVITNLKLREEHDIDKILSVEKQLKFLNEIIYKRSQSIQTIHMMAPKVPTYNGRPTFSNPRYLKQAQSEIPCLYVFPHDQSTHAKRLIPDGEETLALKRES
uniref:CCHC-type domain-containing protein n=1 Tax=Tanacetum cinerariifolium TaxID=118510 RepID=A0A6L2K0Q9_TANCI|nr:hypothetical protein [Tanacetum cinerariifolium]